MAEYNGWANYETWCVNLHLSNDQDSYNQWRDTAREICGEVKAEQPFTAKETAKLQLCDRLKDEIKDGEFSPVDNDVLPMMYRDLLNAALDEVDWGEVADAFLEGLEAYESLDQPEETEAE